MCEFDGLGIPVRATRLVVAKTHWLRVLDITTDDHTERTRLRVAGSVQINL